jgi:tetratricopeptide (TPR) repeat protein
VKHPHNIPIETPPRGEKTRSRAEIAPKRVSSLFLPFDIPLMVLLLTAVVAWAWTRHYYAPKEVPFPRESSEFQAPDALEKTKADAEALVQKEPENMSGWVDLAVTAFQRGPDSYVEGLEALERARDLGALDDRLFYYAGVMYESKGLLDYARPEYERFLRHHPGDLETRLRLGNLYYRTDELDKAIEQYEKVLQAKPLDPLVAFNLAVAYKDKERWSDGLRLVDEVLKNGRHLPNGEQKLLGDLHRGSGNLSKAMEHYNLALSQQKDDAELWEAVSLTYEDLKDYSQAAAGWKRVLELNPKHKKAKEKIRQLQRKAKAKN